MSISNPSRRRFLGTSAVIAATGPLLATGLIDAAHAQELKPLTPDNPQAKALKYVADAAETKEPNFKPGSNCAGCQLFIAATGACGIFPGYAVSPKGWCSVWAKKP